MTGYAEQDIIARGIATSGYHLLRKPIGMENLLSTVAEALAIRH